MLQASTGCQRQVGLGSQQTKIQQGQNCSEALLFWSSGLRSPGKVSTALSGQVCPFGWRKSCGSVGGCSGRPYTRVSECSTMVKGMKNVTTTGIASLAQPAGDAPWRALICISPTNHPSSQWRNGNEESIKKRKKAVVALGRWEIS